jgi:hypothetical protein
VTVGTKKSYLQRLTIVVVMRVNLRGLTANRANFRPEKPPSLSLCADFAIRPSLGGISFFVASRDLANRIRILALPAFHSLAIAPKAGMPGFPAKENHIAGQEITLAIVAPVHSVGSFFVVARRPVITLNGNEDFHPQPKNCTAALGAIVGDGHGGVGGEDDIFIQQFPMFAAILRCL